MKNKTIFSVFLATLVLGSPIAQGAVHLEQIKLPPGFKISVFVNNVSGARSMTWGDQGTLFIGTRNNRVFAVEPNGTVRTIATGLNQPNGVAFKDGTLYVAEIQRIVKFENIETQLQNPPAPVAIATYPSDTHHGWKYMAMGPDGKLYIPQGVACNICTFADPYGTITTLNLDGTNRTVYARGIRNSVGFDWHPVTKELWFTDNGRDSLGDNIPPDELNRATAAGQHFGFPKCHAGTILDPQYGTGANCADYKAPAKTLGPHVASLGMKFYSGTKFPAKYSKQIFIAEHGSWNRSTPIGYRVTLVTLDSQSVAQSYETFAEGWLQGSSSWGRPVDILNAPDGSILVSDDQAGVIYKIKYEP